VYYIEEYETLVIAKCADEGLLCYGVYTDKDYSLDEILGGLVNGESQVMKLGFTPMLSEGYQCEERREEDETLFVLKGRDVLEGEKGMLPLLSHA
jgi:hypothetical protein